MGGERKFAFERVTRISMTIPLGTLRELERTMKELNIKNRSKLLSHAISSYIAKFRWTQGRGAVAGSLTMLYDHERGDLMKKLTHIQHNFADIVRANMHIHLDERNCVEVICIVGDVQRVKELFSNIEKISGIKNIDWVLFSVPRQVD